MAAASMTERTSVGVKAPGVLAALACAALALVCGTVASRAQEQQATWALYDAAPFMITDGADRDAGIFDQIRHLLDERLGDYSHRTVSAPFPRILTSLKDGAEWCFVGGVETPERDAFATFSLPIAMFYPLRIVVHDSQRARFVAIQPLSLATLLRDRGVHTSILRNRALAPAIDALLRQNPPGQVYSDFREAFRMLLNDRLDYLIEYSSIASYNANVLGHDGAFPSLPFVESPAPVFSRVMCPKTEWGKRLGARIDEILRAERPTQAYRRIVEAWSAPEDIATVRDVYDSEFLTSR